MFDTHFVHLKDDSHTQQERRGKQLLHLSLAMLPGGDFRYLLALVGIHKLQHQDHFQGHWKSYEACHGQWIGIPQSSPPMVESDLSHCPSDPHSEPPTCHFMLCSCILSPETTRASQALLPLRDRHAEMILVSCQSDENQSLGWWLSLTGSFMLLESLSQYKGKDSEVTSPIIPWLPSHQQWR